MGEDTNYLRIIKQAQFGSQDDMSCLTTEARQRVFVYIYRVTLDYHLAQDLAQDTVLEMIKSLKRLKIEKVNSFWSWLYRTALGKIQHHFRYRGNRKIEQKTVADGLELLNLVPQNCRSGLNALLKKERSQVILNVMGQIKAVYRNILTLRCFDQMSYADIAAIMGVSEAKAMLLFFRAKQSLKKQLARNGFKKEHLLPALGLFGAITASSIKPASAAIVVNSAAAKVGIATAIVGTAISKPGIIAVAATVVVLSTAPITIKTAKTVKNNVMSHADSNRYLYSLVRSKAFEQPNSLIRSWPDGSTWKAARRSAEGHYRQEYPVLFLSPDKLLLGGSRNSNDSLSLYYMSILPAGHWLEFGFSGEIIDGPGIDVCFEVRSTGQPPLIFITDDAGQEVQLTSTPICYERWYGTQYTAFDISGLALPFKPRALRFVGTDNEGPWGGAELCMIWARVRK